MNREKLESQLRKCVRGEIHFDPMHRRVYSVDASIYEVEPIGIVIPQDKQALIDTVAVTRDFNIPIIARGAATGITGGCLGTGLIVDTSKYLNRILSIDYENEYAICEPGVVQDRLNEALSAQGYRLGPDTSTGNRATLGGMLANNAAGARSLYYGSMIDHVIATELILASGDQLRFEPLRETEFQEKCTRNNIEGHIYREVNRIRSSYKHEIEMHFPKIPRRVSGYNLNTLIQPDSINLSKLIVGSEGSLGIATEIKVKISRKPKKLGLCVIHFENPFEGMRAIETILQFHPIALEMIDHRIIEMAMKSPSTRGKLNWLQGIPQAVFVAEFSEESSQHLEQKLQDFSKEMKRLQIGFAHTILIDPIQMSHVWDVRKSGLGLLLSKRSYSRAIGFLEDLSLSPHELAPFMEKFCAYLKSKGKEAGIYGHVGAGCMHVRPYIDLRQADETHLLKTMMEEVSSMVLEHGGALSGEHGDGLIRSWLNKKMFGERLYQAFIELKAAFDPENLMNPGKVVHGLPVLKNLRIDPETITAPIQPFLDFSKEGGLALSADLCNGNGMCRKSEKLMCPSFQASGDEFHTTRARAQALRAVMNGKMPIQDFTSEGMHDVLDLCLQCKGCKTECPSEVDMAKMKTEFLHHYHKAHGSSWRDRIFASIGKVQHYGSFFPSLFNSVSSSSISKMILHRLGISSERTMPQLASKRFSKQWDLQNHHQTGKTPVVLFNDTFTEFNQPEIGISAAKVLEALGYAVIVPEWTCCGRPAISKGFLPQAKKMAAHLVATLLPYAEARIPIIGLEPSCLLTIKDDFQGLLGYSHTDLQSVIQVATTFDEFIAQRIVDGKLPLPLNPISVPIKLHGHCHQKALIGTSPTLKVLKAIPNSHVTEIDSGCCGMAGSFGYESEHYNFSLRIGELRLFPAIRDSSEETIFVANGFSCRCQIEHGTQKTSYHLAELLNHRLM